MELEGQVAIITGAGRGIGHIISAMEACNTYKPWHDKQTHRTFLRPDTGKCLHYCFDAHEAALYDRRRDELSLDEVERIVI